MTTPGAPQRRQFTHPLKAVMDAGRHPWVWAESTNKRPAPSPGCWMRSCTIPGCWRRHPRLMHELPVLYWQWVTSHHHPDAGLAVCGGFYDKVLPSFQHRLDRLIGAAAAMCHKGHHSTPASDNELKPTRNAADVGLQAASHEDEGFIDYVRHAFSPWDYGRDVTHGRRAHGIGP